MDKPELIIELPNNFIAERTYVVDVFFKELLPVAYTLKFTDRKNCLLSVGDNKLIVKDAFWKSKQNEDRYLRIGRLPEKVKWMYYDDSEEPLVSIYGSDRYEKTTVDNAIEVKCGVDLFASAFFMLTRWEEYVLSDKDQHDRFPYTSSLAWKQQFLHRPVVNEYVYFIKQFLEEAGMQLKSDKQFRFFFTCDIDFIFKWKTIWEWLKTLSGDLFKRKSLLLAGQTFANFLKAPFSKHTDPYNTYNQILEDGLATKAEKIFYILLNKGNQKILRKESDWLFQKLKSKGGIIGIHPDYNSHIPNGSFNKEKHLLEEMLGEPIIESRQHFLRFEVPETWSMLSKRDIEYDSSMYYTEIPGFRTGCCSEYSCFDVVYRTKLTTKERTLCFMDTSLFYDQWQSDGAFAYLSEMIERINKYNGDFVMLWHNSSFDPALWSSKKDVYRQIISYLKQ